MSGKVAYGIPTDGFLRYYDANSIESYVKSGSVWNDLVTGTPSSAITILQSSSFDSGSQNPNITFVSTATAPFAASGSLSVPYYPLSNESFAVDIWYTVGTQGTYATSYTTILSSASQMLDNMVTPAANLCGWSLMAYSGNFYYGIRFTDNTGPGTQTLLAPYTVGRTYNIFLHRNTFTQKIQIYLNGARLLNFDTSNNKSFGAFNTVPLVNQSWQYGPKYAMGKYHSIKLYRDRNFTEGEILQNYLSLKSRFGL